MTTPRLVTLSLVALVALAFAAQAAADPGKPRGLRIVSTTANSITMTWRKPAGAARYRIYKRGNVVRRTTARRVTVSGIRCHKRYAIAVRAVDSRGRRGPAATRSVRKGTGCVARSRIVLRNPTNPWSCRRPLSRIAANHGINGRRGRLPLLVRVNFTTYRFITPGVVEIRRGCRGDRSRKTIDLILQVNGDGRTRGGTVDAIKVREDPHDIQITGYANCGPRSQGAHQDGAQIQGGNRIEFIDFEWGDYSRRYATCHGAAGTFVPGSVNNWPVRNMACIRCKSVSCNHGMLISGSRGTYVEDSRWRTGNPADRRVPLATGVTGLCNFGSPACLIDRTKASGFRIVGNRCDRWPYRRR